MNGVEIATETVVIEGRERVSKFVVTGPAAFLAELAGCLRDECAAGQLAPCIKPRGHIETVDAWLRHIKTHCHGWHAEKVEAFAAAVAKPWRPKRTTLLGITAYMRQVDQIGRVRVLAPCESWPVVEQKPLPAPCECESCQAILALIGATV